METIFTQDEVDHYIALDAFEVNEMGRHRYDGKTRWIGKLGEESVHRYYPSLVHQKIDFRSDEFDFLNSRGQKYEVKTIHSDKISFSGATLYSIDQDQVEYKQYYLVIFCHYEVPTLKLNIAGWILKNDILLKGKIYKRGEQVLAPSGRPMFPVLNQRGLYLVHRMHLNPPETLPL